MILDFVGVQGSGKGTQAKIISKKLELAHISTGDLLRGIQGELKEKVDSIINEGKLIPNDLMLQILKERMKSPDCEKGIILDGFPRNIEQARDLDKELSIDKIIEIKISDEMSLKRLSGRVTCEDCGEGYNLYTELKPSKEGICDKCGGKLVQRADDNEEAIKKRIQTYHQDTEPILSHYQNKVITVDGEQSVEKISQDILNSFN